MTPKNVTIRSGRVSSALILKQLVQEPSPSALTSSIRNLASLRIIIALSSISMLQGAKSAGKGWNP